jgi:FG-GAP repeat protein
VPRLGSQWLPVRAPWDSLTLCSVVPCKPHWAANLPSLGLSQGAVYAFLKPAGGWVTTSRYAARVLAADGAKGDQFGYSVSVSGTTGVIGAVSAAVNGNTGEGAAYLFGQ